MKGHARDLMTARVDAAAPTTTLAAMARLLDAADHGGLPVVDDGNRVLGFVSIGDVVQALLQGRSPSTEVREIMASPPVVIDEFAPFEEVSALLRERGIHHVPVVRAGVLVGIISPQDLLGYYVAHVLEPADVAG